MLALRDVSILRISIDMDGSTQMTACCSAMQKCLPHRRRTGSRHRLSQQVPTSSQHVMFSLAFPINWGIFLVMYRLDYMAVSINSSNCCRFPAQYTLKPYSYDLGSCIHVLDLYILPVLISCAIFFAV